ncbi:MAG: hypothetical protein HKN78_05005 [Sphingomonadaceae bacterium]|nr:hypothetical protein [Sphingomonadaceae bacterium]
MRYLATPAAASLFALALSACEDAPSTDIEQSPSIVAEGEAPELSGEDTFDGGVPDAGNDVLFRAVGQEPGWIVRIYENEIVYEADYGQRTVRALTPEPEETEDGRRYVTNRLTVEIVEESCTDSMSGAGYAAQVTVTEGERTVQGCGGEQLSGPDEGA